MGKKYVEVFSEGFFFFFQTTRTKPPKTKPSVFERYVTRAIIFQKLARMDNRKIKVHEFPKHLDLFPKHTSDCQSSTSQHFSPACLCCYFMSSLEERFPIFFCFFCSQLGLSPQVKSTRTWGGSGGGSGYSFKCIDFSVSFEK